MFRIQKLMLLEYRDIYEPVIVENPFTQIRACGEGLRQYHIGLTQTKIIFAVDDFDYIDLDDFSPKSMDPEIETLNLVSLMPLQFLKFNFYRKRDRNVMRICICGEEERPMLFEFGGHLYKSLFWNMWRERVATIKLFQPDLFYISCASPFSSTDVLADDEVCYAQNTINRCDLKTTSDLKSCDFQNIPDIDGYIESNKDFIHFSKLNNFTLTRRIKQRVLAL